MATAQKTKDTQVYQGIRRHIMGHHYQPGKHLREDELCHEFNVTRTPVRLALRRLEQEKLVINEPFRGVFVRQVQLEELNSLFDIREVLEGLSARNVSLACELGVLEKLAALARDCDDAMASGKWAKYFESDKVFHHELFRYSGNVALIELIEVHDFHLRAFVGCDLFQRHIIELLREGAEASRNQHLKLVEVLGEVDGEKAEVVFRHHVVYEKALINCARRRCEANYVRITNEVI